jgi:NAD(P)-dependent dehydrogenase (short-subunit alcohol dehydrogenase family)
MVEPMNMPITELKNVMDVKGQNVIVTGGNSGIGWGISRAFAQRGANVAILGIELEDGNRAVKELQQYGGKYIFVECDITNLANVKKAVDTVYEEFGRIDVLVNCAGISAVKPLLDMDDGLPEWHRVINVNLNGTVNMTYAVANKMRADNKGGLIINISSTGGATCAASKQQPMDGYIASKAALNHLSKAWAIQFAEYNIRVNCIMPGPTTSRLDDLHTPEYLAKYANRQLTRRKGEGIEIGALCVFIASPEGCHLDGIVIPHDGGFLCIS